MTTRISKRMDGIAPFHVMDILARAKQLEAQGRDIVHMEVGEPDFVTLPAIIEAGRQALAEGKVHYTPAVGLAELRQTIADYYRRTEGLEIPAGRIVVTPGASGALQLVLGVTVNPGEQVMMADPGYPCNRHMVRMFNGGVQAVPVDATSRFQLTAALVEQRWREDTRAVMLASPSNPTGTLVSGAELAAIAEVVRRHDGLLIVDEIYHGLVYAEPARTALHAGDDIVVINSFSKYFGMTGWRLGWLVAPQAMIDPIDRLAQNIFLAAPTPAQHAAIVAMSVDVQPGLDQRRDAFRERRDYLMPTLQGLGFRIESEPQGAFYLYANASGFTDDSMAFCRELLEQTGVAITPGADFGDYHANEYVRFAYTTGLERLQEGVRRLGAFLAERQSVQ